MSFKFAIAALGILTIGTMADSASHASTYQFEIDQPAGSTYAGDILRASTSYNAHAETFSWSYDITPVTGSHYANSFWLVVSPGENPKDNAYEYPIFYGDLGTGTLYSYTYDGTNNANSFNSPGDHIATFQNALSIQDRDGARQVSFSIDAGDINAHTPLGDGSAWSGVAFDEKVGVWFHPSIATIVGNGDQLSQFSVLGSSWYDTAYEITTVTNVSEPAAGLLIIGAMAFFAMQRRRATVSVGKS